MLAGQASVDAGHAQEAVRSLKARRMEVFAFHDFAAHPNVAMVEAARDYAAPQAVNLIVGLGALMLMWSALLNGRPSLFFDTAFYYSQAQYMAEAMHLVPEDPAIGDESLRQMLQTCAPQALIVDRGVADRLAGMRQACAGLRVIYVKSRSPALAASA